MLNLKWLQCSLFVACLLVEYWCHCLKKISQSSQQNTCARVSFLLKLQALAQVFSCEFCEIFKNIFFTEHLWAVASVLHPLMQNAHSLVDALRFFKRCWEIFTIHQIFVKIGNICLCHLMQFHCLWTSFPHSQKAC